MEAERPIIVIKKKKAHHGHHGGAWKVAYADFVTAMMSLFIVLWLMASTSKQTQEEIAGYFHDPKGSSAKKGMESKPGEIKEKKKQDLDALKKELLQAMHINGLDKLKKQIEVTVTDEGLRIELIEDAKGTFFELGSAAPTPALIEILKILSDQLKEVPNNISIEGHTDAQKYAKDTTYGNWELSTDRANVARRQMQNDGIRLNQISQVRGFADQRLHYPDRPLDPGNRRVSLVVQNLPDGTLPESIAKLAKPSTFGSKEDSQITPKAGETATAPAAAANSSAVVMPPLPQKPAAGLFQKAKGLFK